MTRFLLLARLQRNSILLTSMLLAFFNMTHAQELKLGSNPTVISKASILELESTTRGLLLPRIPDTSAAPLPNSPDGMIIFFTVDSSLYIRKGGSWQKVADGRNMARLLGPAGGDLTGTYPHPQIAPAAITTAKLADGNVTYGKIQPVSTPNALLGRYGTAPGPVQEVTLGTGISMSNTGVLSATGTGGTVTSVSASVPAGLTVNVTNPATTPNIAISTLLKGPLRGTGNDFTTGNTNLATEVSGILPIANGGTGLSTTGTAGQQLRVKSSGNGLEYFTTSGTAPITYSNGSIGITQASATTSGYLASTDWSLFNSKLALADSQRIRNLFSAGTGLTYNAATGTFANSAAATSWLYGGNAVNTNQQLGTTTAFDLPIITGGAERMRVLSTGNVGIGLTNPAATLGILSNMELRRSGTNIAQLTFTNTNGAGDFRIGSDGQDIYWQGGGGRNLEMGAFWGTYITGDRQASSFPALTNGVGNTAVTAFSSRAASVPLAVVGATGQTANLQEWRNSSSVLNIVNNNGNMAIGATTFDAVNPEKVLINAGTTNSVNALYMKGSVNNYFQANIRNLSNGSLASSDLVATADNGSESTNFMDIGINGSGYVYQNGAAIETGKANDTYMLSAGNDLYIVNNNPTKSIIFLSGGTASTDETMRMTASNRVGIATSNPTDTLTVAGPFRMGANGTRLNAIIRGTVTNNTTTVIAGGGGVYDITGTVANVTTGATVSVSPAASLPAGLSIAYAFVPSAGSVTIRIINTSITLLGIPLSVTLNSGVAFNVTVTQ